MCLLEENLVINELIFPLQDESWKMKNVNGILIC